MGGSGVDVEGAGLDTGAAGLGAGGPGVPALDAVNGAGVGVAVVVGEIGRALGIDSLTAGSHYVAADTD